MQEQELSRDGAQKPDYSEGWGLSRTPAAIETLPHLEACLVQFSLPVQSSWPRPYPFRFSGGTSAMAQRQAQPMGLLASTHPGSLASSEAGPQRGSGSP